MNYCKSFSFGPVKAFELGFSPIGSPLMTAFMYMVDSVIIDTGQRHMQKYVARITEKREVDCILLTHHHEDHSGNAGALGKLHQASIFGHELTRKKMEKSFCILPYQHCMSGKAGKARVSPFPSRIRTGRFCFKPVHTPGHSKDHTVYLEEENGWLFSGDLYLGDLIHFYRVDEKIGEQIASLEKILAYDFDALFCGHRPHFKNGKSRLESKLSFLKTFHGTVSMLLNKGYSEKAIIKKMRFKSDLKVKLVTMGNASFKNMARSSIRDILAGRKKKE